MWTIGQLAAAAGTSVRALRHYDRIGLVAATRSANGHRRYRPDDVARVRRVIALRMVGLTLAEIGEVIDGDEALLATLIRARRRELDTQLAELELTRRRLVNAANANHDTILNVLEDIMTGSTFTPEQLQQLKERHSHTALTAWTRQARDLDMTVRALLDAETPPTKDEAFAVEQRWGQLLDAMADNDTAIRAAIVAKLDRRGAVAATHGAISEQAWSYLRLLSTP